ncbi:hypothetical protein MYX76_16955 [Desulfobacterota bacterium AH_259_B03_O07]|nr:hypothetical protein [Desulfobacterota bacterium AH_259_B03_O07]
MKKETKITNQTKSAIEISDRAIKELVSISRLFQNRPKQLSIKRLQITFLGLLNQSGKIMLRKLCIQKDGKYGCHIMTQEQV